MQSEKHFNQGMHEEKLYMELIQNIFTNKFLMNQYIFIFYIDVCLLYNQVFLIYLLAAVSNLTVKLELLTFPTQSKHPKDIQVNKVHSQVVSKFW